MSIKVVYNDDINMEVYLNDAYVYSRILKFLSLYIPISSMSGAIRSVTPTSNRHIISSRQAVATIVNFARCGSSSESGSIT